MPVRYPWFHCPMWSDKGQERARASTMKLGLRKPVPLLPLMTEIVRLLVPVRSALAGMAKV